MSTSSLYENSLSDFEIVRKIVEREGCVEALKHLLPLSSSTSSAVVLKLFDQVRLVSVQIVEEITKWKRKEKKSNAVFEWRGQNYLLKMTCDLNTLPVVEELVEMGGFESFKFNPFLLSFDLFHPIWNEQEEDKQQIKNIDMQRLVFASRVLQREYWKNTPIPLGQQQEERNEQDELFLSKYQNKVKQTPKNHPLQPKELSPFQKALSDAIRTDEMRRQEIVECFLSL